MAAPKAAAVHCSALHVHHFGCYERRATRLQLAELAGSRSIGAFSRVEYLRRSSSLSAIRKPGSFETTKDVSVRYWWVNHKQTFRHEFEGGYIWSPKRKWDGSRNLYYDFLREVIPGDVVFTYAGGADYGLWLRNIHESFRRKS